MFTNNEIKKSLINSVLAVITLLLVFFLWKNTILLAAMLAVTSLIMLLNEKDKVALYLYLIAFLLGPLTESLAIYSGAWNYANAHIFGFSLWLPFVWGNAGLFFRRMNIFLDYLLNK